MRRVPLSVLMESIPSDGKVGSFEGECTGISIDSRTSRPGECFVALPGWKKDGARFVGDAVFRGAAMVVATKEIPGLGVPQWIVEDPRRALLQLCSRFYGEPEKRVGVWGITGTSGKTTTSLLLKRFLEEGGEKIGLVGTLGYGWGEDLREGKMTTPTPPVLYDELARMVQAGVKTVVMEVSSHALDQGRVDGLRFEGGIWTNLSREHLDYHATMEAYRKAKGKLLQFVPTGRPCILNADDPEMEAMRPFCNGRLRTFGIEGGDVRAEPKKLSWDGTEGEIRVEGETHPFRLPFPGRHNVYNFLAAFTAAMEAGIDPAGILERLPQVPPVPGRLEPIRSDAPFQLFVDYAHKPAALASVLMFLRGIAPGRLVCLFGCGGDRDRGKRPEMGRVAEELCDHVWVTSDNPRSEDPHDIIREIVAGMADPEKRTVEPDRREAIRRAVREGKEGEILLIAGKGHETGQIFRDRTVPFDDRSEAREALRLEGYHIS